MAIRYDFPVDGEYAIKVRLRRQYQDYVMGMGWPQQLDVRLDGALVKRFTVGGEGKGRPAAASYAGDGEPGFAGDPEWEKYMQGDADAGLEVRMPIKAGPRLVGVSFVRQMWEPEGLPQPLQRGRVLTNDQIYMGYASVGAVSVAGPYSGPGSAKDTPSRRAIFVCEPRRASEERDCATKILTKIARLAYRRPAVSSDVQTLLQFFSQGRSEGGSFDAGIQFALERVLVDPDFLLRVHRDPRPPSLLVQLLELRRGKRPRCPISSSRRACPSSCGTAFPTSGCSMRPSAGNCRSRRSSSSRCGACWPTRARRVRSSTTLLRNG